MRLATEEQGMSAVVEFCFVAVLLLFLWGGLAAYALALHARAVVVQAAFAAARTASLTCDPSSPGYTPAWPQEATAAAEAALRAGFLPIAAYGDPVAAPEPGVWDVVLSCSGGQVSAQVRYDELDLFPPLAAAWAGGSPLHGWSLLVQAGAVVPAEP